MVGRTNNFFLKIFLAFLSGGGKLEVYKSNHKIMGFESFNAIPDMPAEESERIDDVEKAEDVAYAGKEQRDKAAEYREAGLSVTAEDADLHGEHLENKQMGRIDDVEKAKVMAEAGNHERSNAATSRSMASDIEEGQMHPARGMGANSFDKEGQPPSGMSTERAREIAADNLRADARGGDKIAESREDEAGNKFEKQKEEN